MSFSGWAHQWVVCIQAGMLGVPDTIVDCDSFVSTHPSPHQLNMMKSHADIETDQGSELSRTEGHTFHHLDKKGEVGSA